MATSATAAAGAFPAPATTSVARIRSIDIVRGLACVLMAIDHVRVYSGVPAGSPDPTVFLTRWVTHFVAPVFCFFAGSGAWFMMKRLGDPRAMRRFLVSRGLLLVVLELTLIRFLWAFNVGTDFMLAGVIWMLGWCMVLLALFIEMPAKRVGWIGVTIVLLQQLFGLPARVLPAEIAAWWSFFYPTGGDAALGINVLYVLIPWVGVMMAGFGFGLVMERDETTRRRTLLRLGLGMTAVFVVVATTVAFLGNGGGGEEGGPAPGGAPLWMRVLNQQKYPASQLFLLMTLGPAIALLPIVENAKGFVARALEMFGRVPMWFYLMHIAVIHVMAVVVTQLRTGEMRFDWFARAPYTGIPPEGRWSLGMLYLVWAICILLLYPLCAWYASRKRTRPTAWMKYL